jgi:hypothetical protein
MFDRSLRTRRRPREQKQRLPRRKLRKRARECLVGRVDELPGVLDIAA